MPQITQNRSNGQGTVLEKKKATPVPPITREEFLKIAEPAVVQINGTQTVVAEQREFSTGSMGWFANGRIALEVGGKRLVVQAQVTLTVVGSKELPK